MTVFDCIKWRSSECIDGCDAINIEIWRRSTVFEIYRNVIRLGWLHFSLSLIAAPRSFLQHKLVSWEQTWFGLIFSPQNIENNDEVDTTEGHQQSHLSMRWLVLCCCVCFCCSCGCGVFVFNSFVHPILFHRVVY